PPHREAIEDRCASRGGRIGRLRRRAGGLRLGGGPGGGGGRGRGPRGFYEGFGGGPPPGGGGAPPPGRGPPGGPREGALTHSPTAGRRGRPSRRHGGASTDPGAPHAMVRRDLPPGGQER